MPGHTKKVNKVRQPQAVHRNQQRGEHHTVAHGGGTNMGGPEKDRKSKISWVWASGTENLAKKRGGFAPLGRVVGAPGAAQTHKM